jgi:hypothetical protein
MDDAVVWIIIIAFYAPLHYLMPILVLFITGNETEEVRWRLIRGALLDSSISMVIAFAVVIALFKAGWIFPAMLLLLLSMFYPFLRILRHRREIVG